MSETRAGEGEITPFQEGREGGEKEETPHEHIKRIIETSEGIRNFAQEAGEAGKLETLYRYVQQYPSGEKVRLVDQLFTEIEKRNVGSMEINSVYGQVEAQIGKENMDTLSAEKPPEPKIHKAAEVGDSNSDHQ